MPSLTCPHCGSALSVAATETAPLRCPVCGAALSSAHAAGALPIREAIVREEPREEDDSATRAVPKERMAPLIAQAQTDHQRAPYAPYAADVAQGADETTRALPASALPLIDASETSETTQELPLAALPHAGRAAALLRPLSVALVALVLLAVVVVTALAANGAINLNGFGAPAAESTATTAPAATATPSFVVYSLPGFYAISHPQGWLMQQSNHPPQSYAALLTAPTGNASLNIEAQQAAGAPALATLDGQFIQALAQPGTPPAQGGASVTIGGQAWTQVAADVTLRAASGQTAPYAHVVALSTQRGAYVYTITYLVPAPTAAAAGPAFTTADGAYFQPMLASFTFLN